jgi:hypothetical protein
MRMVGQSPPRQIVHEILSQNKILHKRGAGGQGVGPEFKPQN